MAQLVQDGAKQQVASGTHRTQAIQAVLVLGAVGLVGITWWGWPSEPIDTSLKTYEAPKLRGRVDVDGRITETAWHNAPAAGPFVISTSGAEAPLPCTARIVWDATALYVAFEADDGDILSPHRRRDDDLYTQDVAEIFLDPGSDGRFYYEFEISPSGVLFDALFPSYRKNLAQSRRWNARTLQGAATLTASGWSAELKIPFSAITHAPNSPPKVGESWRMNLFRIDKHKKGGHYTAWTPPLKGDFHTLNRFGTLVFVE